MSSKQQDFIRSLVATATAALATASESTQASADALLTEAVKATIVAVSSGQDVSNFAASEAITALLAVQEILPTPAGEVRWAKLNNVWLLKGDAATLVTGATVTVTARKGESQKVVGTIIRTEGETVWAAPAEAAEPEVPPVEGLYRRDDGVVILAKLTRRGFLVGHEVEPNGNREYLGKAGLAGLTPEHKLTLEQAKAWGWATGFCVCCSRLLTDPVSVEAGIGPICASRF